MEQTADLVLGGLIAGVGVVFRNTGDLRTGPARQSVHASNNIWCREPLRLQVIVEAESEAVDATLARQPAVADLFDNGLFRVYARNREDNIVRRHGGGGSWTTLSPIAC